MLTVSGCVVQKIKICHLDHFIMTNNIPVDVPDRSALKIGHVHRLAIFADFFPDARKCLPDITRVRHSRIPECNFEDKLLWHNLHRIRVFFPNVIRHCVQVAETEPGALFLRCLTCLMDLVSFPVVLIPVLAHELFEVHQARDPVSNE